MSIFKNIAIVFVSVVLFGIQIGRFPYPLNGMPITASEYRCIVRRLNVLTDTPWQRVLTAMGGWQVIEVDGSYVALQPYTLFRYPLDYQVGIFHALPCEPAWRYLLLNGLP